MRTSAIFLIALFVVSAFASTGKLSLDNRIQNLKKTQWGKVAAQMIELQLTLGGAVDELVGAFYQLGQDLGFQVEMEEYEWTLKTSDHNTIEQAINDRIRTAETNIHAATHEIVNVLQPLQESLSQQIAYDENLVSETNTAMDTATTQRGTENAAYNEKVGQHTDAIAAVQECMQLLNELDDTPTLIQMTKAKNHIKKLEHHLNQKFEYGEMIKVMIDLAQNFADQGAVDRVQAMLANVLGDLQTSLTNAHDDEADSVLAYNAFMLDSQNTLDQANTRLTENRAALTAAQNEQVNQETFRESNQADLDTANDDLDAETSRWDSETTMHTTLMGELSDELAAIDEILDLCASVDISDDLYDSMNSI